MLVDVAPVEGDFWIATIVHECSDDKMVFAKFVRDASGQKQFWGLPVERTATGRFRGANGAEFKVRKTEIERVKKDRGL